MNLMLQDYSGETQFPVPVDGGGKPRYNKRNGLFTVAGRRGKQTMEVELLKKYDSVRPGEIENLDGTTETVDFRFSTAIRFYHNMEDADFPLHWHAPGEIISPIEGTYTVTIAGKTVTLQPYDVLIIASGELHSIRAPKTGERYIMNYSVSYFQQIQDMAELFNTFYPLPPCHPAGGPRAGRAAVCGADADRG